MSNSSFTVTSRYYNSDTLSLVTDDGKTVAYLRRRLVPGAENFSLLLEYPVADGDRLDTVTAEFLGDPEQFWRVCDANNAMLPDDLTAVVGTTIRITLPQGVPGFPTS